MTRPEILAYCSKESIRDPKWTTYICACKETITHDGMPERRVGDIVHGVLCCARYETEGDAIASMEER